ncbi:single-stranded-DNA-specific exonuclease RecJ [Suttonella sp. R2A3]|uniref:single-stranded-DNA-specific exonuclease RecJ n=1 Tax=Suttonella sp. R2A3 TaxID=2908648 RepID=UPI001F3B19BE|nr:single-stranded-DNA-specific exonuclease RecJ [Suttonella sp. R2A3]UJF23648.1 single-stranded-DNA-specific exonuclease RecJ [Suttonella sp. R2A3]
MLLKDRPQRIDPNALPQAWHPLVRQIYASRLDDAEAYDKSLAALAPPQGLCDIDAGVTRIIEALDYRENILIYGDYDVDGTTATALMVRVLRRLHAKVDWFLPDRRIHGYGLSIAGIDALNKRPDLIITVDNGIQSHAAVDYAREKDIDVLITDHHLPSETLPNACAVINPQRTDNTFNAPNLCGVGVAFYLLLALRRALLTRGDWDKRVVLTDYLDLVALGTIADVVPLTQTNRILVHAGLQRIRSRQGNAGILALCAIGNIDTTHISAQDIAFAIAPRLNAAGRMGDMRDGVALLLSDDWQTAHEFANAFDIANRQRKAVESEMLQQALYLADRQQAVVCVHHQDWHEGVIGIVAGRLKSRLNKPALIATDAQDPEWLKASLRSVEGVDIKALLDIAAAQLPAEALQYGGHAMAAGLSVKRSQFSALTTALNQAFASTIGEHPQPYCYIDGALDPSLMQVDWANYLNQLEPWGAELPQPTFCNTFDVLECRILGSNHSRLSLREPQSGRTLTAVWFFNQADYAYGTRVRVIYALQVSRFYGDERLNLLIEHIQAL